MYMHIAIIIHMTEAKYAAIYIVVYNINIYIYLFIYISHKIIIVRLYYIIYIVRFKLHDKSDA